MTTTTVTETAQARAARVLLDILATPGLPRTSWDVGPDGGLKGYVYPRSTPDGRDPIRQYAATFGLKVRETWVPARSEPFMEVRAEGVYDGVPLVVWTPISEPKPDVAS